MEREIDLPKNYFDIVHSIYALGWTTDLKQTLELIYSYLKEERMMMRLSLKNHILKKDLS